MSMTNIIPHYWTRVDYQQEHETGQTLRDRVGRGIRQGLANALSNAITGLYGAYTPLPLDAMESIARGGGRGSGARVSTAPIWTQEQIQTRVNESNALAGARTEQQNRAMMSNLARQGMATQSSPLAMSLGQQNAGRGLLAALQNENMLRWEAARGNAEHTQRAEIANAELAAREAEARQAAMGQLLRYNAEVASARNRDLAALSQILAGLMGPDMTDNKNITKKNEAA